MRILTNCENDFEAQLIIGRLENEGIKSVILNEYIHNVLPLSDIDNFAVQVVVNDEDYNRAIMVISVDTDTDGDVDEDIDGE